MTLTLGKWRRLQQAAGSGGTLTVLAIDHRGPLRRALAREVALASLDGELAAVKEDIVRALVPHCTAVLLDPELGAPRCLTSGALPPHAALLVALDTGSTGDPQVLQTGLVPNWGVRESVRLGAVGVKLLVYFHPAMPDAAQVEQRVRAIAKACRQEQMPLYLEPILYSPAQPGTPLPSSERQAVVMETARRLVPLGVDVLKVEFPVNTAEDTDRHVWRKACRELTAACPVPWVLLSAGVPFDLFLEQARIAGEAGASGVIAGRTVWNDAVTSNAQARWKCLATTARERMDQLRELCESVARPVTEVCRPPEI